MVTISTYGVCAPRLKRDVGTSLRTWCSFGTSVLQSSLNSKRHDRARCGALSSATATTQPSRSLPIALRRSATEQDMSTTSSSKTTSGRSTSETPTNICLACSLASRRSAVFSSSDLILSSRCASQAAAKKTTERGTATQPNGRFSNVVRKQVSSTPDTPARSQTAAHRFGNSRRRSDFGSVAVRCFAGIAPLLPRLRLAPFRGGLGQVDQFLRCRRLRVAMPLALLVEPLELLHRIMQLVDSGIGVLACDILFHDSPSNRAVGRLVDVSPVPRGQPGTGLVKQLGITERRQVYLGPDHVHVIAERLDDVADHEVFTDGEGFGDAVDRAPSRNACLISRSSVKMLLTVCFVIPLARARSAGVHPLASIP